MTSIHADLVVIGFGKGGKTLAAALGRQGKQVVMIEQSTEMYGGTCINIGCVPTKALIHDAVARRPVGQDADDWYTAAVSRKDEITGVMRATNFDMLDSVATITVITGQARFTGPREVDVRVGLDMVRISSQTIVIDTGSVPVVPDIRGVVESRHVYTSTTMIDEPVLPRRLAIIGGGNIGLEFAGMYRAFGSEVTILESASTILSREDSDVADAVSTALVESGVHIVTNATVTSVQDTDGGSKVTFTQHFASETLDVDAVLIATGRRPATDGLGLAAAGVRMSPRGAVEVDEFLRTTTQGIYAVGDVNGGPQFTYISMDDYRIVLDQLTGDGRRSTKDRVAVPHTLFLDPPLAGVGLTEGEARGGGRDVVVAKKRVADIATMPRSRIVGDTRGMMKFVIDGATDRILGARLFCIDAQELINLVALAIRQGTTATELRDGIWTHPTTTEGLNEVLSSAQPVGS